MLLWALQTYLYSSEFYLLSLMTADENSFDISFYQDFTDTCFNELGIQGVKMNLRIKNKHFKSPFLINFNNFDVDSIYLYVRTNALNASVYKRIDEYCKNSSVSFNSLHFVLVDNVGLPGFTCEHPLVYGSSLDVGDLDVTALTWDTKRFLSITSLSDIETLKRDFTGIPFKVSVEFDGSEWEKSALKELLTYDYASLIKIELRDVCTERVFDDYINIMLEYGKKSETQKRILCLDKSIITDYIFMDEGSTALSIKHLEKMCKLKSIFTRITE